MKKLLITMAVTLVCVGAFGQGKLSFQNDGNTLIYFSSDSSQLAPLDKNTTADGFALAGSGAYLGTDPNSGQNGTILSLATPGIFTAAVYGGTSASSLSLQTVTTIDTWGYEGQVVVVPMTFATLPANTMAYFQVVVWNNPAGSTMLTAPTTVPTLSVWDAGWYGGETTVFTASPSVGAYTPITTTAAPTSSTWTAGTFATVDGAGNGSIALTYNAVPEPGTFALAGLGLAALLVFRRRK